MKKIKKITAALIVSLLVIGISISSVVTTQAAVSGNFRYSIERDDGLTYVEIDRYLGKQSKVVIPSKIRGYKVREINENAFKNNTSVKTIVIGSNIKDIEDTAFAGTKKLEKFIVKSNSKYKAVSGVLVNKNTNYIEAFPQNKATTYTVPKSIRGIDESAFKGNKKLTKITFENVRVIEEDAFKDCSKLKTVGFSNSLKEIDEKAFYNCPKLKKVTVPKNVREIDEKALGYGKQGKVSGFTIRGYSSSVAYKYAKRYGFKFSRV